MGKASAARVTLRSVEALEKLAASVPPMAYDIRNYASLGILWKLLPPGEQDIAHVTATLEAALADILEDRERGLSARLQGQHRQASRRVRELLEAEWEGAD
jgi:malonate decarboxylase gamma subunit